MKKLICLLLILCAQIVYPMGKTIKPALIEGLYHEIPKPPPGFLWTLRFNDEFDGNSIDLTKWHHTSVNSPRRDGWWRDDATIVDGKGNLVVKTFKDGEKYVSGAIETKYHYKYGFYIARVKTQTQAGQWSAFWLWPESPDAKGAVEIDIFEYGWGTPHAAQNALHWYQGGHSQKIMPVAHYYRDEWHTFAVWYTPSEITFYRDGKVTWKRKSVPSDSNLQIILSTEIGKVPFGKIQNAKLPDQWLVDWVRHFVLIPAPI